MELRVCNSNRLPGEVGPKAILCGALDHISTMASTLGSLCSHCGGPMAGSLFLNSAAYSTHYWDLKRISGVFVSHRRNQEGGRGALPLAVPLMSIPCHLLSSKMMWELPVRGILLEYQSGREIQALFVLAFLSEGAIFPYHLPPF